MVYFLRCKKMPCDDCAKYLAGKVNSLSLQKLPAHFPFCKMAWEWGCGNLAQMSLIISPQVVNLGFDAWGSWCFHSALMWSLRALKTVDTNTVIVLPWCWHSLCSQIRTEKGPGFLCLCICYKSPWNSPGYKCMFVYLSCQNDTACSFSTGICFLCSPLVVHSLAPRKGVCLNVTIEYCNIILP